MLIDLEGHGREEIFADVDLSRTLGWFTSLFPVRLDAGAVDLAEPWRADRRSGARSRLSKNNCTRWRTMELGYGLLRYLNAQTALQLSGLSTPEIGFNYLGRFPGTRSSGLGRCCRDGGTRQRRSRHAADPLIEVNALTLDGADGATRRPLGHGRQLCSREEVRDLAQGWFRALEALVRHAEQPGAGGRSPCDLPLLALSQAEIERLESKYPQIEDMLPLSPLQEGLLFHALYDAQAADVYTVQLALDFGGALEGEVLQASVRRLCCSGMPACARALSMRSLAGRCRSCGAGLTAPGATSI